MWYLPLDTDNNHEGKVVKDEIRTQCLMLVEPSNPSIWEGILTMRELELWLTDILW